jgi:4-hydroxymandelate oxidase
VHTTRREALASLLSAAVASPVLGRPPRERSGAARQTAQPAPAAPPADRAAPLVSVGDYEATAKTRMSRMAYEYVAGGAGDEITLRANREAFDRLRLHPRVLVDVSQLDTRVRLFDQELPFPILLAPTAYHRLVHPEGELATVRGAANAGATLVVSSFATTSVEDMSRAAKGPLWFQVYVNKDRGFTRELVQRAERSGCRVLCVTVDSPVVGARNREARAGFALPPGIERSNLKGLGSNVAGASHRPGEREIYSAVLDPRLTWKEIEWLRSFATVPVLIKGVLSPDDAAKAADAGLAGVMVSNHGARNLDTVPATIEALPRIADAVKGRLPLLIDGGIRRGTDVLKALALGASAVLVGRPYLYGLGTSGAEGVTRVVGILRTELEMAMALTGRRTLAEIDRSVLWTLERC